MIKRTLYALVAVAALVLGACTPTQPGPIDIDIDIENNNTNGGGGSPGASPSPGGGGPSDVNALAIFVYGLDCTGGPREPAGDEIPADCTGLSLTATPKTGKDGNGDGKSDDAVNHGSAITWSAAVTPPDAADVSPHPANTLFNRYIKVRTPRKQGSVTLTANLVAPDGRTFNAVKTITIR